MFEKERSNLTKRVWHFNFSSMRPCDWYLMQFDFSSKLLFDSWCSISESVNHVSDHGFKCILGSVISTGKSVCYEVSLRFYIYLFYVCRWCFLQSSTFELGPLFLKQNSVPLWSVDVFLQTDRYVLTSVKMIEWHDKQLIFFGSENFSITSSLLFFI